MKGQTIDSKKIVIKKWTQKNAVLLRWAPTSAIAWEYLKDAGYQVERYTIFRDSVRIFPPEYTLMNSKPLTVDSLRAWAELYKKTNDPYIAIAAQCYFGKTFEISTSNTNILSIINKSRETENRFGFAMYAADRNPEVAQLSGLWFKDSTIKPNEKYLYRVYSNLSPTKYPTDTAFVFINPSEKDELPKIKDLSLKTGYGIMDLQWSAKINVLEYSAYFIQRSYDGKNWTPVNSSPFTPLDNAYQSDGYIHYSDTVENTAKLIYYRIYGTNSFGIKGPFSNIVKGKSKEELSVSPTITQVKLIDKQKLLISWEFPDSLNQKIWGFELTIAPKATGPFKKFGNFKPDIRNTFIQAPYPSNYIVILAQGKDTVRYPSNKYLYLMKDDQPPSVPKGLSGYIDSAGRVYLHWHKNKEEDWYGYQLFVANAKHEEFSNTYPIIKDTSYVDSVSLQSLSNHIYYKIAAMDNHYNRSDLSEPLKLKKPDKIAPAVPVFSNIVSSDSAIVLTWANSNSNDVRWHKLFRYTEDSPSNPICIFTLLGLTSAYYTYSDNQIEKGKKYFYYLNATDFDGNISKNSEVIRALCIDMKVKPKVNKITGVVSNDNTQIEIRWQYPTIQNIKKQLIYRSENNKPLRLYATLYTSETLFIDKNLTFNTKYAYRVRIVHADGGSSPISNEVIVKY